VLVSLTSEGARHLDQRRAELADWIAEAIDQLPDGEATAVSRAVPALRQLIDGIAAPRLNLTRDTEIGGKL
jgi:hypothetical protein